ncbi:hypothetical protein ACFY4C_02110 [Actinomadura viridis]|uniref:hypothetical protein n=1 Tax=Actinomadura viridis TaxID=58110 RepID=UPI0036AB7047
MPSAKHETVSELFRQRPVLAAEILDGALGLPLPAFREARLRSENITDDRLAELRADAVIEFREDGRVFAVIVEVQLGNDPDKHFSWPAYLMGLRARLKCTVILLVICPDKATARWCGRTIDCGHPGMTLTPLVVGPGNVPHVTDGAQAAANPELAVLSALVHGSGPSGRKVLAALPSAYPVLDDDHRARYHDLVNAALPEVARRYLEEQLTLKGYEYQSDFARKYFDDGKAEGKAEGRSEAAARMILAVLRGRGLCVTDEVRERIVGCGDFEQLMFWHERSLSVASAKELFD